MVFAVVRAKALVSPRFGKDGSCENGKPLKIRLYVVETQLVKVAVEFERLTGGRTK
jgi:hypothetical protein